MEDFWIILTGKRANRDRVRAQPPPHIRNRGEKLQCHMIGITRSKKSTKSFVPVNAGFAPVLRRRMLIQAIRFLGTPRNARIFLTGAKSPPILYLRGEKIRFSAFTRH
jgi:hypothetical protein